MSLLGCSHEGCARQFTDQAALLDHAEAVHTYSERRQLVSMAVRTAHGKDSYLLDLADDWLVFDTYDESAGGYKVFKQSYSMDAKGNIKLAGGMMEVVRKISYVPVPKIEIAQKLGISYATEQARARPAELAAIGGVPVADSPHDFAQEDPSFSPNVCTDCGRHKVHFIHTGKSSSDSASRQDTAGIEASQATIDLSKEGSKSQYEKKKGTKADIFICPTCKAEFQHDADVKSHRKQKSH